MTAIMTHWQTVGWLARACSVADALARIPTIAMFKALVRGYLSEHRSPPGRGGLQYPPNPPTVEEIVAVMRAAGDGPEGVRLSAIVVVLWRAGLRISEALALNETDLDPGRGSLVVRHGITRQGRQAA